MTPAERVDRLPLSRARVVGAALRYVDHHGLEALSMRKLGAELGVEAMSLYNHVASKDDLLDGVVDSVLAMIEIPDLSPQRDWRMQLRELADSVRAVGLAHPEAFSLILRRPKATADSFEPMLALYQILKQAGLDDQGAAIDAFYACAAYVLGYTVMETGILSGPAAGGIDIEDVPPQNQRLRQYLSLKSDHTTHGQFRLGFEVIIAGIERQVGGLSRTNTPERAFGSK
ncbi:MAG: TetR/AcrR family transcriptional regulator [Acidimicrobiales bacterium]